MKSPAFAHILRLTTALSTVALAASLQAQTSPAAPAAEEAAPPQDIVVTGSRIRNPNGVSAVPITSITAAELKMTGQTSIGDAINDLPGTASSFSQSNSTRFLGTAGLNLIDLYGLGTQRTLVLVNGRRHVGSDVLNNGVSVDINTLPTDLIDNVDIVTGGNSAVYGSDAIAGVVNFRLKDHYQGLQVRGQGDIKPNGAAGTYYGSILAGKNFAEGRGNIAVDLEYQHANPFYASQDDHYATSNGYVTVESDPPSSVNGAAGGFDNVFYRDRRLATLSDGGTFTLASPTGLCGRDSMGRAYTCNYLFQPNGTLVPQTGTRVGLQANAASPSGTVFVGGNGNTGREDTLVQLYPQMDRYSANLVGHYEISPAIIPYVEASFTRTKTVGQGGSGPAFINGTVTSGSFGFTPPLSTYERPALGNPFLSAQARQTIVAAMVANGVNPATITDATRFTLRENLVDVGTRTEAARRDTFRIVAGVKGDLSPHLHYDVSGNYGKMTEITHLRGIMDNQRFLLAMDAQRNAAGQIVCGAQINPARAGDDFAGNPAKLAADISACVPINPFGLGNVSQAVRNYLLTNINAYGKMTQLDLSGAVTGDTGAFFNLPGGPIGFSVGGEYRRETVSYHQDAGVENGYYFYNPIPPLIAPAFKVTEGFAEVSLPLLKELPFIEELTVGSAARYAHYQGAAGNVWTYNATGRYKPIRQVTFRGGYNVAVRAPNIVELYSPVSTNFAPNFTDPCSADHLAEGTAFRAANCTAAGRPALYNYSYTQSLLDRSGGNANLKPEDSQTISAGIVLEPFRGLTMSADYYDIRVNNVIASVDAQTIVNQCYDLPSLTNQFCGQFARAGAGGGPAGEQQFRILEGSLLQSSLNYAKYRTKGINTDVSYTRMFGRVMINAHAIWNHQLVNDQFVEPTNPNYVTRFNGTIGLPKDQVNLNLNGAIGKFFASYRFRYLSKMTIDNYATINTVQGRAPTNLDQYPNPYYPSVTYSDIRVGVNVTKNSMLYFGIDNLFNKLPPLGSIGIGNGAVNSTLGSTGIYDNIGRRLYAGVTANF